MKKKPYDVYSPEIYPRLLFVSIILRIWINILYFLMYTVIMMEVNTISYYKKQINMMEEWLLVK